MKRFFSIKNQKGWLQSVLWAGCVVVVLAAALVVWRTAPFVGSGLPPQAPGLQGEAVRLAPELELPDSGRRIHHLNELRGRVAFVHFWASWCPPCLSEIPDLIEFARSMRGKPFTLVTVSVDKNWGDALKVLPDASAPGVLLSLLDAHATVSDAYGSYQFPETYLLSKEQSVVWKWVGPQDWGSAAIAARVRHELED